MKVAQQTENWDHVTRESKRDWTRSGQCREVLSSQGMGFECHGADMSSGVDSLDEARQIERAFAWVEVTGLAPPHARIGVVLQVDMINARRPQPIIRDGGAELIMHRQEGRDESDPRPVS